MVGLCSTENLGNSCDQSMWCASIAGWMLSDVLNNIKEVVMKAIEKVNNYVKVEIIATAVVGAGHCLMGMPVHNCRVR